MPVFIYLKSAERWQHKFVSTDNAAYVVEKIRKKNSFQNDVGVRNSLKRYGNIDF
jgi:hypothetical protein